MIQVLITCSEYLNTKLELVKNCSTWQNFGEKSHFLIIDDSLIKKTYSKFIEGTSDNYDSADRKQYRSLCSIVAMLSDGTFALPIDQKIWTLEEFAVAYKNS